MTLRVRFSGRIEAQANLLLSAIEETPDLTLAEVRERLITRRGELFALSTIHEFSRRHGIIFEKTAQASEQDRADVTARRAAWAALQPQLNPTTLVFLDETATTTKMARQPGRAPHGHRCRASVPPA